MGKPKTRHNRTYLVEAKTKTEALKKAREKSGIRDLELLETYTWGR